MKKSTFAFVLNLVIALPFFSQMVSVHGASQDNYIPTLEIAPPNVEQLLIEDQKRDELGLLYRNGIARTVNISPNNSGIWSILPNGDRQWMLRIKSVGAEALSFLFETFKIYGGTTIEIQNNDGLLLHPVITSSEVQEHFMYNAALCFGDEMMLRLTEPKNTAASEIFIDRIMYGYRSIAKPKALKINESEACQVNVNCTPVGNNWQEEKRGIARILVIDGGFQGWCTGSLVNNLANDCKPLFLTAFHCAETATAANLNQWKFYFRYEAPTCTNPNTAGTLDDHFITGCFKLSDSGDGGGSTGSDFLLVQLGTAANQANTITTLKTPNYNAYWNGWDANNSPTTGGVGIHHPAGDIKKISTFNGNTVSSTWGSVPNTHWRLIWSANANGHGVTEGGSSGSPLFNNSAGRIIGTLTGGGSFCNATNQPDYYGKISYHWISNGSTNNRRLKPFLDPANTGALTLNGSADPCSNNPNNDPCAAAADTCDEYIKQFLLNSINNSSNACTAGGYADYTNISTSLAKGSAYSATVVPGIIGQAGNIAYTGDEVAVWIDYNNNNNFSDAGEQVGYVLVGQGWSNVFNFTVPMSATTGMVHLRTRISYQGSGPIAPCGTVAYGETEDYMVNITAASGISELNPDLIRLFPNPTNDKVTVDLGMLEASSILIYDLSGKLILSLDQVSNQQTELSTAGIAQGLYHVKIVTTMGEVTKPLIKN